MLRVEAYPVLDGLAVAIVGIGAHEVPELAGQSPSRVTRVVHADTIESIGIEEALRDVFVDVVTLYPGILKYALLH